MAERVPSPKVVAEAEWLSQRKALLEQEKELTRQLDHVNAARRRLPMVKLGKTYTFEGPNGKATLLDLFEGRRQLIVYHFMFDPAWQKGCMGCTGYVEAIGDLSMLAERNTSFVLISRAPLAKLEGYKKDKGWKWPWYSSFGSDFNYDFHVTLDESVRPVEYGYRSKAEMDARESAQRAQGRGARPERVFPHRRRRVPHVLDVRTRHRIADGCICAARSHAVRTSGRFRGLAAGLAAEAHVRLTASPAGPLPLFTGRGLSRVGARVHAPAKGRMPTCTSR